MKKFHFATASPTSDNHGHVSNVDAAGTFFGHIHSDPFNGASHGDGGSDRIDGGSQF